VVCIIYGCPHPLVLRAEGPFWRLLGDAFVEGVMKASFSGLMLGSG
jgi:hypothetical protein